MPLSSLPYAELDDSSSLVSNVVVNVLLRGVTWVGEIVIRKPKLLKQNRAESKHFGSRPRVLARKAGRQLKFALGANLVPWSYSSANC